MCFCLTGALHRVSAAEDETAYENAMLALCKTGGMVPEDHDGGSLPGVDAWELLTAWNDEKNRTHTEVLALVDAAVEKEMARV